MLKARNDLRSHLSGLIEDWRRNGAPSRSQLQAVFEQVLIERSASGISGLWGSPPSMLTATLDDGWGHGLQIVESCARAAGVEVYRMGLLKRPEEIVAACMQRQPDLLGLTVLQLDSEDALAFICRGLPPPTRLIAGGPPFQIDPELAERVGVHFVASHVTDFLGFLLDLPPCIGGESQEAVG